VATVEKEQEEEKEKKLTTSILFSQSRKHITLNNIYTKNLRNNVFSVAKWL